MATARKRQTSPLADVTNLDKQSCSSILDGLHFAISGKFSMTKEALKDLIERHGGKFSATVTQKVTHLITTEANVSLDKRPAAVATAFGRSLPMVSEGFVFECLKTETQVECQPFSLVSQRNSLSREDQLSALERTIHQKWNRMMLKRAFSSILIKIDSDHRASTTLHNMYFKRLVGDSFDGWLECSERIHQMTQQMMQMQLDTMMEAEKSFASLTKDDDRTRLLLDTNVLLRNELTTWEQIEKQHGTRMKFFICVVVFDEIDKHRKDNGSNPHRAAKARQVFQFLTRRRDDGPRSAWEMQLRDADAPYKEKHQHDRARSADLRFLQFARDCNRVRPGAFAIVTNDQPVLVEASACGVRALSDCELLAASEFAVHGAPPPAEPGRPGRERAEAEPVRVQPNAEARPASGAGMERRVVTVTGANSALRVQCGASSVAGSGGSGAGFGPTGANCIPLGVRRRPYPDNNLNGPGPGDAASAIFPPSASGQAAGALGQGPLNYGGPEPGGASQAPPCNMNHAALHQHGGPAPAPGAILNRPEMGMHWQAPRDPRIQATSVHPPSAPHPSAHPLPYPATAYPATLPPPPASVLPPPQHPAPPPPLSSSVVSASNGRRPALVWPAAAKHPPPGQAAGPVTAGNDTEYMPRGWTREMSKGKGLPYYVSPEGVSQWHHPIYGSQPGPWR